MDEEFHLLDLLGLEARLAVDGPAIGTVSDLISGGNDLLEITTSEGRKLLIPFVEAIVPEVQLEEGWLLAPHHQACWSLTDLSGHRQNPLERAILGHRFQDVMASTPLIPVILCGGTGTRLWPLSRASYPKQYWPLSGDGEATLLQTQQRLQGLDALAAPLLICNEDHRFIVAEQMRQIGVEPNAILLEPMGRNTAPAVTVAALQATANGEDPLLLVLAADHLIRDAAQFRQAINAGRKPAEEGRMVTFGIVPAAPETGYGYIEASEPFSSGGPVHVPIKRFVRSPIRPQRNNSWPPAASPEQRHSCSAPAPCWRN